MTRIFKPLISQTVEVYIDDIVVKNKTQSKRVLHLEETFCLMKAYNMKLNPTKCAFGVKLKRNTSGLMGLLGPVFINYTSFLGLQSKWRHIYTNR